MTNKAAELPLGHPFDPQWPDSRDRCYHGYPKSTCGQPEAAHRPKAAWVEEEARHNEDRRRLKRERDEDEAFLDYSLEDKHLPPYDEKPAVDKALEEAAVEFAARITKPGASPVLVMKSALVWAAEQARRDEAAEWERVVRDRLNLWQREFDARISPDWTIRAQAHVGECEEILRRRGVKP